MSSNRFAESRTRIPELLQLHWPLALIAVAGLALMLTGLSVDYLWGDEGDTAVLGANVLKFGLPKAWDGVTFTDADLGARDNDALVMVSHPWLQYYAAAASFALFGENAFAARLPFALAGCATLIVVYLFAWRVSRSRIAALCAAALLLLSPQFLLYARQSRYYTLAMLLTCVVFWIFLEMNSARRCAFFVAASVLLFHSFPVAIVPLLALGILSFAYRPLAPQRRWIIIAAPFVVALTAPWLLLARAGYAENSMPVHSIGAFFARFLQFLIECTSVTPLIGAAALLCVCAFVPRLRRQVTSKERALIVMIVATLLVYGLTMAATEATNALWYLGVRYTSAVIPLVAMLAGIAIARCSSARVSLSLLLLCVFSLTNISQLTPWMLWSSNGVVRIGNNLVAAHVPRRFNEALLRTGLWMLVRDFGRPNPGVTAQSCEFLSTYASRGEIVIANADWDPLYFHTHLPQGFKILPSFPIYPAARAKALPEYVFTVADARWIIWRPYWEGVDDYRWDDVAAEIRARGGRIEHVADIDETITENREDIFFHRFSGDRYLFSRPSSSLTEPAPETLPRGAIFRVDWPR